jgi:hypothetical protein
MHASCISTQANRQLSICMQAQQGAASPDPHPCAAERTGEQMLEKTNAKNKTIG